MPATSSGSGIRRRSAARPATCADSVSLRSAVNSPRLASARSTSASSVGRVVREWGARSGDQRRGVDRSDEEARQGGLCAGCARWRPWRGRPRDRALRVRPAGDRIPRRRLRPRAWRARRQRLAVARVPLPVPARVSARRRAVRTPAEDRRGPAAISSSARLVAASTISGGRLHLGAPGNRSPATPGRLASGIRSCRPPPRGRT